MPVSLYLGWWLVPTLLTLIMLFWLFHDKPGHGLYRSEEGHLLLYTVRLLMALLLVVLGWVLWLTCKLMGGA